MVNLLIYSIVCTVTIITTEMAAGVLSEAELQAIEERIKEITTRTGYPHEVTFAQRKYGGPPPDWTGPPPGAGCEIYCGKIPNTIYDDELIPLFEAYGKIYDMRLMMDAQQPGKTKGFCFCLYAEKTAAQNAAKELDGHEIRPGKALKVNVSIPNCRLFVSNIPKSKSKDDIFEEFSNKTEGLVDVIVYGEADNPKAKNRGFCFLDYETHKAAADARKKFLNCSIRPFNLDVHADWAEPQHEPDAETMSKVKVLYVRNLKADVTEELMKEKFSQFGEIEKVKKIKDYGFVHYLQREDALKAMEALNGTMINDSEMLITLARPQNAGASRLKEKKKLHEMMGGPTGFPGARGFGMRGRRMMPMPLMPGPRGRLGMLAALRGRSLLSRLAAAEAYGYYDDYDYYDYYDDSDYYDDYSYYGGVGLGGLGGLGLGGLAGLSRSGLGGIRGRGRARGLAALKANQESGVSVLGSLGRGTTPAAASATSFEDDTSGIFKVIARGKLSDLRGSTAGTTAGAQRGGVKRMAISELNELYGKTPKKLQMDATAAAEGDWSMQTAGAAAGTSYDSAGAGAYSTGMGSYGTAASADYTTGGYTSDMGSYGATSTTGEAEWYQDSFTGTEQWG